MTSSPPRGKPAILRSPRCARRVVSYGETLRPSSAGVASSVSMWCGSAQKGWTVPGPRCGVSARTRVPDGRALSRFGCGSRRRWEGDRADHPGFGSVRRPYGTPDVRRGHVHVHEAVVDDGSSDGWDAAAVSACRDVADTDFGTSVAVVPSRRSCSPASPPRSDRAPRAAATETELRTAPRSARRTWWMVCRSGR